MEENEGNEVGLINGKRETKEEYLNSNIAIATG